MYLIGIPIVLNTIEPIVLIITFKHMAFDIDIYLFKRDRLYAF